MSKNDFCLLLNPINCSAINQSDTFIMNATASSIITVSGWVTGNDKIQTRDPIYGIGIPPNSYFISQSTGTLGENGTYLIYSETGPLTLTNVVAYQNLNNNTNYQFNFSTLTQGKYELSFSFCSNENDQTFTTPALLNINWNTNNLTTQSRSVSNLNSQCLGIVYPGLTSSMISSNKQNPPTILTLPQTPYFNVSLLDVFGRYWYDSAGFNINLYVLQLYFRKIED